MSTGQREIAGTPHSRHGDVRPDRRAVDVLYGVLALLSMLVVYVVLIWLVVGASGPSQKHPDGQELGEALLDWARFAFPLALLVLGLTTLTFHLFLQRGRAEDADERDWLTAARVMAGCAMLLGLALMMLYLYVYAVWSADPGRALVMPYAVCGILLVPAVLAYAIHLRGIPAERRFRMARLIAGVGLCGLSLVSLAVAALPMLWPSA